MTSLTCLRCDDQACWWDEAPPRSGTANEMWCDAHVPSLSPGWARMRFAQDDGVWRFKVAGEWLDWPLTAGEMSAARAYVEGK